MTARHQALWLAPVAVLAVSALQAQSRDVISGSAGVVDRTRVHHDEPGDGTHWARGATYKACFEPTGATYVPFLGPEAPRNFPLRMTLARVTVGDRVIGFDARAMLSREGDRIRLTRGSLTEAYDLSAKSVEQLFLFDAAPSGGDLTLRIRVESELAWSQGPAGFVFANAHGAVRYGDAFAVDAIGQRTSIEASWRDGAIELRVPAETLAAWEGPLTIDPVVATFPIDTFSTNLRFPDVAYDATADSYLVVYEEFFSATDFDVYSTRLSSTGAVLDGVYVDLTAEMWLRPAVANNRFAEQFLVVVKAGPSGGSAIKGRTREAGSTIQGAPFQISGPEAGDPESPGVGGDLYPSGASYYCVVWQQDLGPGQDDVFGRMVRSDGSLVGGGTMILDSAPGRDLSPQVSKTAGGAPFGTATWCVTWLRTGSPYHDVMGTTIRWDGSIVDPSFVIVDATYPLTSTGVSSPLDGVGPRTFLVAHVHDFGSDTDIELDVVRGAAVVTSKNLSANEGSFALNQDLPRLDSDGRRFVVTYRHHDNVTYNVYAATVNLVAGQLCLTEGRVPLSTSGSDSFSQITSTRAEGGQPRRYMAVWDDYTLGPGNIEGALYDAPGPLCEGIDYCGSTPNSTTLGARMGARGSLFAGSPITLYATQMPPNQFGYFLASRHAGNFQPPGSQGFICLANPIARFAGQIANSGTTGSFHTIVNTGSIPMTPPVAVLSGEVWRFQAWFRDAATSNFTNGLEITFL